MLISIIFINAPMKSNISQQSILYVLGAIAIIFILATTFTFLSKQLAPENTTTSTRQANNSIHHSAQQQGGGATCAIHACGAIDPVSDPEYNMKEIIKQSLMLEEHLVEKNKRCKDCQAKHFLMIIGLSEEALSLAGAKIQSYPLMDENPAFYNRLFEQWLRNKDSSDDAVFLQIADELRTRRKALVQSYVLKS